MTPQRILIVEGDGQAGREVQANLVRHGYSVPHIASTGERAIELVDEIEPDLVVIGLRANGSVGGIEAAERILERFKIPIIYLAVGVDEEVRRRAEETSPSGILHEPHTEEELVEAVRDAFKTRDDSAQRLEASERRFVSTLRSIAEGVIMTDLAGTITFLNPMAEEITGWSSDEACGRALKEVFRIRERDGKEADPLMIGAEGGASRSVLLTTKSGHEVAIEDNTAPIKDERGGLTGLVVVFRRSEEVREGETAAGEAGNHLVKMVESIMDPMFTMDAEWRITYVNNQAGGYFGAVREEILGRVFWDDFPPGVRERYLPRFAKTLTEGAPQHFEFYHEAKDGWFEVTTYPFADGVLTIFRDITEKKKAIEEGAKLEKLEGLGFLARGFAHDFNNLLTVLLGNLSLAISRVPESEEYYEELVTAKRASVQAQNLVQQLLTFAKGGAPIKKEVSLRGVVERLMKACQARRRETKINYFYNVEPGLWRLHADENQILRLLQNLVRNAEQAVSKGGDVMVHCKNLEAESALPDEAVHLEPGANYVVIKVIDNGEGIPDEIRHRIFEPYFSGPKRVNASGLGLTVCESIAKGHGGFLVLDSEEERGTTVSVFLPAIAIVAEDAIEEKAGGEVANFGAGAGGWAGDSDEVGMEMRKGGGWKASGQRILVLEDELLIRELIVKNLTEAGYEVHQAAEGTSAVHAYRQAIEDGRKFDLVLMDLSIPEGMGGREAIGKIRRMDPNVVAIVSSGYSDDPVMANYGKYGFSGVLPKPYEPMELRQLVAEVLERNEARKA